MSDLPWFAFSPSPWTLIFWAILTFWLYRKIQHKKKADRFIQKLSLWIDGLFIVGFFVLVSDSVWVMGSLNRWGPLFPWGDSFQMILCLFRNAAGLIFLYLLTNQYFKEKFVRISKKFLLGLALNALFMGVWFYLAPSPAFTDWTFAIRYDYDLSVIVFSFFLSHVVGRIIWFLMFYQAIARGSK